MDKPRIGLVHYTYPPIIGGVERLVFDHAQLFTKHGFDTSVFTGDGINTNTKIKFVIVPEFKSLAIINPPLQDKLINSPTFPDEFNKFSSEIYQKIEVLFNNIDILIVHNIFTNTYNLCLNSALVKYAKNHPEKKIISWTHDAVLDKMRKKRSFPNHFVEEIIYKAQEHISYVAISDYFKNTLVEEIGFPPDSITIVPNGINVTQFFNSLPLSQIIIEKYDLLQSDLLIFLPTKIMRHKNIDVCIKILAEIKKVKKSPMMIITAKNLPHHQDTSYMQIIFDLIDKLKLKENIILLDDEISQKDKSVEFEVVKDFYRLSDIVFFLSSHENFGLPLLEAGISKTPILCNNLEVFKEIEPTNVHYVDIQNENPKEIANKVFEIVENNPRMEFFRKVKKEYNLDTIFKNKIIPLVDSLWQSK